MKPDSADQGAVYEDGKPLLVFAPSRARGFSLRGNIVWLDKNNNVVDRSRIGRILKVNGKEFPDNEGVDVTSDDIELAQILEIANTDGPSAEGSRESFLSSIPFGQLGSVFGSNLSRLIDVENPLAALAVGTTIGVIGLNLGQQIERAFDRGVSPTITFKDFPQDLAAAGCGRAGQAHQAARWLSFKTRFCERAAS